MRKEPTLQPRMIVSSGCSGSSAVTKLAHQLLYQHGLSVNPPVGAKNVQCLKQELFVCEKNPYCHDGKIVEGLSQLVAMMARNGTALVLEGSGGSNEMTWNQMLKFGTKSVVAWRSNMLARHICEVRDCFPMDSPPGANVPKPEQIAKRAGPNADACFDRRELPPQNQTKVWLDPESLVERLGMRDVESYTKKLTNNGYEVGKDFVVSEMETLLGYQLDKKETTLGTSITAWHAVLQAFGVEPQYQLIRAQLLLDQGTRHAAPLSDVITNAEEVAVALRNAGARYAGFLEEGKGGEGGGSLFLDLREDA